jgi:hypothetical protein
LTTTRGCAARNSAARRVAVAAVAQGQLRRRAHAAGGEHAARHALVVAAAHRDRARQLGQRLAAADAAAAEAEPEVAEFGVQHLGVDAAPARLVDDDLCVDVQPVVDLRSHVQPFVDRVAVLHAVHRHALEAELLVQADRLGVVVHHRQVHVTPAGGAEAARQLGHQRQADAVAQALRVDRERPQAGAALGVAAGLHVVDAGDDAEDRAGPAASVSCATSSVRRGSSAASAMKPGDTGTIWRARRMRLTALLVGRPRGAQVQPRRCGVGSATRCSGSR